MDKTCPICFGVGWVCENHPDRAWDAELGCQCGAGMPSKCNDGDDPDISQVITEVNKTTPALKPGSSSAGGFFFRLNGYMLGPAGTWVPRVRMHGSNAVLRMRLR